MEFKRKRKTLNPCDKCGLTPELCLCSLIPRHHLKTRLCLVIHHRELKRTTNTGSLAIHALPNSTMKVRGLKGQPLDLTEDLSDEYQSLLLYPSDDAETLTPQLVKDLKSKSPIQLIVPDGNWRQASKVHTRQKELKRIPRVKLTKEVEDKYFIRKETVENGMATLQAIAEAFKVLESHEVGESLLKLYEEKLKRTLIGRGTLNQKEKDQ